MGNLLMANQKMIQLRKGLQNFNYKGVLYQGEKLYQLNEDFADVLLSRQDDFGNPYFVPTSKKVKMEITEEVEDATGETTRKIGRPKKQNVRIYTKGDSTSPDEDNAAPKKEEAVDTDDDPSLDDDDPNDKAVAV
jgi:hypothetical protein